MLLNRSLLIFALKNKRYPNNARKWQMQSITAPESVSDEYLSDYAYIDTVRLSHYYGQLSQYGLSTQTKRTFKTIGKDTAKVGVKALVATGEGATERTSEEWYENQTDPAFSRPQETLDALYDAGFIHSGLTDSRIGTLVLIKGQLSIFDLRLLREMWQFMGDLLAKEQTSHIAKELDRQKQAARVKKEMDSLAQMIAKIPHAVQGTFANDDGAAWFTLKPEFMLINPEDITFKHGCDLDGEWHMLGIIDALPVTAEVAPRRPVIESDVEAGFRTMLVAIRAGFGRPPARHGITPIMIFRTLRKQEDALD